MQSDSLRNLMLGGLVAFVAGCYSPYGYQSPYGAAPYGQPMYPGGNPVYTVPNGQPYVPGGPGTQPGLGGPTPLTAPGGSNPSTYEPTNNSGGGIQFNDAPTFNPAAPGGSGSNRGTVPDPIDDTGSGPAASKTGLQPTSGIRRDNLESPFEQESNNNTNPAVQPAADAEADPFFEAPKRLSGSTESPGVIRKVSLELPATGIIRKISLEPPASEPRPKRLNPYGRDTAHANPQWLRGIVDYDSRERSWQIIYSATPVAGDPNGGSLTLGSHPSLAQCRSGDVVLVEGAIDGGQTDARGKPKYVLDKVTPLVAQ